MATKRYYECPAELVEDPSFGSYYRPLLADAVEGASGEWKLCEQDSDILPTSMTVAVYGDASVHAAIAGKVSAARHLAGTFALAKNAARSNPQVGNVRANRMNDQFFSGE